MTNTTNAQDQREARDAIKERDLKSNAVLKVLDIISEGPIEGIQQEPAGTGGNLLAYDATYYAGTLASEFGEENGLKLYTSDGTAAGRTLSLFNTVENTINTGVSDIEVGSDFNRTIPANVNAVRLIFTFPNGLYFSSEQGKIKGSFARATIFRRPNGGTDEALNFTHFDGTTQTQQPYFTFAGKTTRPYQYAIALGRPAGSTGSWNIRVSRDGWNDRGNQVKNQFTVSQLVEIQTANESYPNLAYAGHILPSQVVGNSAGKRTYQVKGILCQVPVNYNPLTHTYSGAWNGQFKTQWTNNPIWVLYDLITNARYGLGEHYNATNVDRYSFYDAGVYCDGAVNGEPRITFNGTLNRQDGAFNTIQRVAATARARVVEIDGILKVIQDRPLTAVKSLSNEDVIDGQFSYSSASINNITTECTVTYNEPDNEYLPETVTYSDSGAISRYKLNKQDVVLLGCTNKAQAERHARWIVDTDVNQSSLITFGISWRVHGFTVGDIINITDDHNGNNATSYKVLAIIDEGGGAFTVNGVIYDPAKYARIDVGGSVYTPQYITNTAAKGIERVRNLTVSKRAAVDDDITIPNVIELDVEWDPPLNGSVGAYSVSYQVEEDGLVNTFNTAGFDGSETFSTAATSFTISNVVKGTYRISVTPISVQGVRGGSSTITYVVETGETSGPSNLLAVTNIFLRSGPGNDFITKDLNISWTPNPSNNVSNGNRVVAGYNVSFRNNANNNELKAIYVPATETSAQLTFAENFAGSDDKLAARAIAVTVTPKDGFGKLGASRTEIFTNARPPAVSLIVQSGVDQVYATITESSEPDVIGYKIKRATDSNMAGGEIVYDGVGLTASFTNLIGGTQYYYQAAAYDAFNPDDVTWSAIVSSQTLESTYLTRWTFEGFRAFQDGSNLRIDGDRVIKENGNPDNPQFSEVGYGTFTIPIKTSGTYYYYFDFDDGATKETTAYTEVISSNDHRLMVLTVNGNIRVGIDGVGTPIQNGDQILSGIIAANHLVTGSAVITGTAQIATGIITDAKIQNATIETVSIKNGNISDTQELILNGPNTVAPYNLEYQGRGYNIPPGGFISPIEPDGWFDEDGTSLNHGDTSAELEDFPFWLYEVPQTGDNAPVNVFFDFSTHVEFETRGTLNPDTRVPSGFKFEFLQQISPVQSGGFPLLETFNPMPQLQHRCNLYRSTRWQGYQMNLKFRIISQPGFQIRLRLERFPYNMEADTYYANWNSVHFRGTYMTATAILR